MAKKKIYKCKVCGKTYKGYRKSGTCSKKCGKKFQKLVIESLKKKKGEFYLKWKRHWSKGIKKALKAK